MKHWLFLPIFLLPAGSLFAGAPKAIVRFDRDIRPLLARCIACHGPGKARAGLRLDSKKAAIAELDSGNRAVVPGKPERSELLRRLTTSDPKKRMPPKGKPLSSARIEKLRLWIAEGADWPRHWAYRPLNRPALPAVRQRGWARTPLDLFILATLTERRLAPSPAADRRTLLRRVSLDLIGLPPTPAQIEAFLADRSPDAYERVVERLLASPHYGERWARHWMDVVHYAETHGHDQDRPREHAWPYRDYLIRAFNTDMPYARFIREQVAGDVLSPKDPRATAATGFLATGPWDESSLRDIREDSLDRQVGRYLDRDDIVTTVLSTFVSTTVHCARCHDHKFDPISQQEYYALQAVFAGTDKANRRYDPDPRIAARRRALSVRKARLTQSAERTKFLADATVQAELAAWEKAVARPAGAWRLLDPVTFRSAGGSTLTKLPDGSVYSGGKRPAHDTYTIVARTNVQGITAFRLEVLTDARLPHRGPGRQDNGNLHLNEFTVTATPWQRVSNPPSRNRQVGNAPPRKLAWQSVQADFNQQGWTIAHAVDGNPATAWGIYPQVGKAHQAVFLLKEPLRQPGGVALTFTLRQTHGGGHLIGRLRLSVTTARHPANLAPLPPTISTILSVAPVRRTLRQRTDLTAYYLGQKLDRELAKLPPQRLVYCGTSKFAPDGSFRPSGSPRPVHILKRGDIRRPGALATPGTLSCVPGLEHRFRLANPKDEGARRAALARWLSDPGNVLAWRSIANRVWQYHFGRGLVATPNDFGRMGSAPTHPDLLNWLAVMLRDGGSLKQLHRLIVTSAVYRQSSRHHPRFAALDADNRYLWRMSRRRLDAESIHDAVLCISGKLDRKMGGPSVRQFIQKPGVHVTPVVDYLNFNVDAPANYRRSVYRFVFRTLPDPFMEAMGCPDGSQLTPIRSASVTALQALSMLNDKFIVRQSEHIAARIARSVSGRERQVAAAYRLILGRTPTAREAKAVGAYARRYGLANTCRVLLNSNEFIFVD